MKLQIRKMRPPEYPLLSDFLYEAIFQRDENNLLPREVINEPALRVYIEDFGTKKDDECLCAEADGKIVGAVWVRNINGYGSIDDETPEFAISLLKEYREPQYRHKRRADGAPARRGRGDCRAHHRLPGRARRF